MNKFYYFFCALLCSLISICTNAQCWQSVSAGTSHTAAIKLEGSLWTWGSNYAGQLGHGSTADTNIPLQVTTATDWKQVTAGASHSLAIKTNGTLWAWGSNISGGLGTGSTTNSLVPV